MSHPRPAWRGRGGGGGPPAERVGGRWRPAGGRCTRGRGGGVVSGGGGGSRRAELHREGGEALGRGGRGEGGPGVAHHWLRSGGHADRAASASRRAGDWAKARRAFADAAGH